MINSNFLAKLSGFWFFYRWYPEIALRYLPIVSEINNNGTNKSILEVGSGGLGITPYLGRKITGLDNKFYPPYHHLLKKVNADVLDIPFKNESFDIVLSVDMLEHLKSSDRYRAISEMFRVAKQKIILAVPCGRQAYEQDKELDRIYKKQTGRSYHFLAQQIDFGLPERKLLQTLIYKIAKTKKQRISLLIKSNENLALRMFLMKGWISRNLIVNFIFRKILLLCIPVFRLFNQDPCYRQIFIIDYKNENRY